jgi:1-acyl-sn-glycerol-3-phosphate acyltransferase
MWQAIVPPDTRKTDPLSERSPVTIFLLVCYLRWLFWRRFSGVRLSKSGLPIVPAGGPVIIYSNHPSWWDPAFYILLGSRLFPGRIGFGPMDAEALARYGILRRVGVFGVDMGTRRGAMGFLSTSLNLLSRSRAMLWITAEGQFTDPRRRPIVLRSGIAHLARRVPGVVILPLAIEYPFWNESRPEALAHFGEPITGGGSRSVSEWKICLEEALADTMDQLAVESATRDASRFRALQHGKAGPGGIYDIIRRISAWLHGQHFDPRHEQRSS